MTGLILPVPHQWQPTYTATLSAVLRYAFALQASILGTVRLVKVPRIGDYRGDRHYDRSMIHV
ncbi:hypothetical protein IQ268_16330 [Oculatella sp. LEGE 06141]|uniref:hypothetical protein n=1 Tax=Oculatella sp. LEGE 06141 TaxID=1828648 RepID=UPI0018824830|nr:hypothetical protein [Oculatella sp. LEGE 06141]MBE9180138.1 hypothetical protein [Oculatella sp. LEGE 06141]